MIHNLAQLAEDSFTRLGDHEALIFDGTHIRSSELLERARRLASGLTGLGIQPGDRVVVLMANCPEVLIAYNALWRAGAVITPVVFLLTSTELTHILTDSGARAIVTTEELLGNVLRGAEGVATLEHVIVLGAVPESAASGRSLIAYTDVEAADPGPLVPRADDDLAALMYTGGTTGRSKGVALTHRNLWSAGRSLWEVAHVPGVTRNATPLPLSHAYGLIVTITAMHAEEPQLSVIQRWFNPYEFVALCEEHHIERTALVPTMIQMLLTQPLEDVDLSALRLVGSGSAPLAISVLEEFERRVPGCEINEGYGLTESGAVATANPPGRRRAGSVGLPVSGYAVRVVDDADRPVEVGGDGEICVQGPGVMAGYWNAPEETAAVLNNGWLRTGDIGHVDRDGYLHIVDRKKDLILRGGFNVFPRDVEDAMLAHPDVVGAAAVGRPDPRMGEEVVAFVVLRPGAQASAEDLIEHARGVLASNKYPREVVVVDAIPVTSVGKLDRKALRARLAASPTRVPARGHE